MCSTDRFPSQFGYGADIFCAISRRMGVTGSASNVLLPSNSEVWCNAATTAYFLGAVSFCALVIHFGFKPSIKIIPSYRGTLYLNIHAWNVFTNEEKEVVPFMLLAWDDCIPVSRRPSSISVYLNCYFLHTARSEQSVAPIHYYYYYYYSRSIIIGLICDLC